MSREASVYLYPAEFQWAPTLGGECYHTYTHYKVVLAKQFQWAPTLGGECYRRSTSSPTTTHSYSFNGHPPLGVNATEGTQYHPTRELRFNGHPPLGVNATENELVQLGLTPKQVSMGTHPWG